MENNHQNKSSHTSQIKFLTPTAEADRYDTYCTALMKAIDEPDVTNIAISGPYGAGKSSVIKSFLRKQKNQNQCINEDLNPQTKIKSTLSDKLAKLCGHKQNKYDKYIEISLANFKSHNELLKTKKEVASGVSQGQDMTTQSHLDTEDIGQIIEKSILQQIFYKVEKTKVPYSKLKRIVEPGSWTLTNSIIVLLMFIILAYMTFNPEYLKLLVSPDWIIFTGWLITVSFLFIGYLLLHYGAKYLSTLKLEKITVKDAEFSIGGESDNGSLINRHIDEILYFFETTSYEYLIIEDLDRYNNVAIYEKLRELNTLINNYDKIKAKKGKIVFIYAIKDDFFVGENRSKFFDIIIPIVPYINATGNARDLFVKDLRDAGIGEDIVSDQLLKDISKYVHDRRLLTNIINEFLVYLDELNPELDLSKIHPEKLFCMIVYKNFFPGDFADLHQGKGWLFGVFNKKKKKLQKELIEQIEAVLPSIHEEITDIKQEALTSEIELRSAYLMHAINEMNLDIKVIQINNSWRTLRQIVAERALFETFIHGGTFNVQNFSNNQVQVQCLSYAEEYFRRIKIINNSSVEKLNELKEKIKFLQAKRSLVFAMKLPELMQEVKSHGIFDDQKILYKKAGYSEEDIAYKLEAPNLLAYFIREEKISEDYAKYISYYHDGGSLSPSDNEFIIRVIEGVKSDISWKINNAELVIDELSEAKFLSPAILNIDLITTLFEHYDKYEARCNLVFNLLKNEELSRNFIPVFIQQNIVGAKGFIKYFTENDTHFWKRLEEFNLEDTLLFEVLGFMLEECDIDTLVAQGPSLNSFIFRSGQLLFSRPNEKQNSMLMILLPRLGGKILNPSIPTTNEGELLFQNMVDFSLYEMKSHAIATIMKVMSGEAFDEHIPDEQVAEYLNIQRSNLDALKLYVEENIDDYVKNIYLVSLGGERYQEQEESILSLIEHETLDKSIKLQIINKMSIRINDVVNITFDEEIFAALFTKFKVVPTWENVYNYYDNMENTIALEESLSVYLSNHETASALSQMIFSDMSTNKSFSKAIVFDTRMNQDILRLYREVIAPFDDISLMVKTSEEVLENVYSIGFINTTRSNYEFVRSNCFSIMMQMLEIDFDRIQEFIFDLEIDPSESLLILQNKNISAVNRFNYLSKIGLEVFKPIDLSNPLTGILYEAKEQIEYDYSMLTYVMNSSYKVEQKIELFMKIVDDLSPEQKYSFLDALGGHYASLKPTVDGKRAYSFAKNKWNQQMFKKLEAVGIVGKVDDNDDEIIVNRKKKIKVD